MYDQPSTYEPDANEHGSRLDPVLARSWLLVNGAQFDRFSPATRSPADIVIVDIEDAVAPKDKDAARTRAIQLWPAWRDLDLKGKGQALADAALIARFGGEQ